MNSRALAAEPSAQDGSDSTPMESDLEALEMGIARSADFLVSLQHDDGHWCAELEGDTILESEYVLLLAICGKLDDPRIEKCARYLLKTQGPEGGWANYPGGPPDVGVTAKAYFALKIAGHDPDSTPMRRAREVVLRLGGAESVNSFTRFYFAALGQIPYNHCPSVPPELLLLPTWFPINIYAMSSWTRTIVVPLSIFRAFQPTNELPESMGISELYCSPPSPKDLPKASLFEKPYFSWANFFRVVDRGLKVYERFAPAFVRKRSLRLAETWMLEHFEGSDGVGAIFPPMVYTILALRCLGYADESPQMQWAWKQLNDLIIEEDDTIRIQPCVSPVWDTGWATVALADAGLSPDHGVLRQSAEWLLGREIRRVGDWGVNNPGVEPSGWAFEYRNDFYADVDDTALVMMALKRTSCEELSDVKATLRRAYDWIWSMQCSDYGWAAFDRDINNTVLESIPFADHNAMLDPSCPDITARVLEMLARFGHRVGEQRIDEAVNFILRHQEPEGCWFGRWGVNYIYGTWQTLVGLSAIGFNMSDERIRKGVKWLKSVQQPEGGWGETASSYADRNLMGQGPATPSQTAWAILGLIAAGEGDSPEVAKGVEYLLRTQNDDGSWDEPYFTGTGFPKVFYLRYHYYRLVFPLMALSQAHTSAQENADMVANGSRLLDG
ncbi:Squalene--hopene cyclase [Planctomycetes bacterium Pan216]|uniref:Squalene--hopene cyclase n=1 Tax=Kolteria novifilia TaxID=2527975 RepID=A0A518AXM5_9BACT|nr:Squalene--hopene cyclase [Planctomycetes bacterium Pan216]